MKKRILALLLSAVMLYTLAACGNAEREMEDYKKEILNFTVSVKDNFSLLSSMAQREYAYWEAYNRIMSLSDYNLLIDTAEESLQESSGIGLTELEESYDEICEKYKDIAEMHVPDGAEEIKENFTELFSSFNSLYKTVTSPSGNIDSFANNYNKYSDSIQNCCDILEILTVNSEK